MTIESDGVSIARLNQARRLLLARKAEVHAKVEMNDAIVLVYMHQEAQIDTLIAELATPGSDLRKLLAAREAAGT